MEKAIKEEMKETIILNDIWVKMTEDILKFHNIKKFQIINDPKSVPRIVIKYTNGTEVTYDTTENILRVVRDLIDKYEQKIIRIDYCDNMDVINAIETISDALYKYDIELKFLEGGDGYEEVEIKPLKNKE